jgi:hypothetical protein
MLGDSMSIVFDTAVPSTTLKKKHTAKFYLLYMVDVISDIRGVVG